jgi:hypothetical protein
MAVAQGQWRVRPFVAGHHVPKETHMALNAVVFPILPGKTAEWREFVGELNGARRADFAESRRRVGAHERTYLQSTPMGDIVIVTLEADDPARAFSEMVRATDPFTLWFLDRVKALHGVDLGVPMTGSPSELVLDTLRVPELAR